MDFLTNHFGTILTGAIGFAILLSFLIPYVISVNRKESQTKKRLIETRAKKQDQPLLQHPIINHSLCIGCGICVHACPEGDVLGLINGKATIIHGSHCVGHGLCAESCPIGGIQIGLGDISQREDIPQLSRDFESTVPGIYIVGELSGMALIRNAISHGVTAVNHIHSHHQSHSFDYDVVIVGAGPSGLSSGLRAKDLGLSYLIIDQSEPGGTILQYPRQKLTLVQPVTLPLFGTLSKGQYTKEELLEIWEEVIQTQSLHLKVQCKLSNIEFLHGGYHVHTSNGSFTARRVILGLGRRGTPRKLGVRGEHLGKVMYKLIDAESYQGKNILIVGGGDSAIEAAMGLAHQSGNHVTISYRKEHFFRLKARNEAFLESMLADNRLGILFQSNLTEIQPKRAIVKTPNDFVNLDNDFVFIFAGGELPFPLLHSLNIQFGTNTESKDKQSEL